MSMAGKQFIKPKMVLYPLPISLSEIIDMALALNGLVPGVFGLFV